ncbi:MAG: hypothetical protein BWY11_00713 [Firmicutes bacterium ADurb.Bin182]|nr:MAG: hypothetical protein BWY11_00713 [Firmicutes bacterium ADurb.Bin182]
MDRTVYLIYGGDAAQMTSALLHAADIGSRIPGGAHVALKPNLVVAKSACSGATTHAGVLEGLIEYLLENGIKDISVIEGSWLGESTAKALKAAGYDEVLKKYGVPFYDLKRDKTEKVNTAAGEISVCQKALNADYLINLPVLKGHCQTVMTCALKNLKGCVPDYEKRRFHEMGLHRPIAALAAALKPALTIVDSICGDLNFEEGGTPVHTNRMLLGFDPVQIDSYCCKLMGISPGSVNYIALAEGFGAGSSAVSDEDIVSLNAPEASETYSGQGTIVTRLTRSVYAKGACSACFGNLVHALYRMELKGMPYNEPVAIGQGWKGCAFEGTGVGECCSLAKRSIKGCPPSAEEIMKALHP